MTHRSDRVRLPVTEPRCKPSNTCHMRSRCARLQAYIPPQGAVMADFSVHTPYGGSALCPGYVNLHTLHVGAVAAEPAPVRPAVKGLT